MGDKTLGYEFDFHLECFSAVTDRPRFLPPLLSSGSISTPSDAGLQRHTQKRGIVPSRCFSSRARRR